MTNKRFTNIISPKKQVVNFNPNYITKPRVNNQITAAELRVIGENGQNLGILSRDQALMLVKPELGIDLIEIAPQAKPPVARLMSFDKYRYQQEKALKKERVSKRASDLKIVQISARAARNDLLFKIRQLEGFLTEGHQVEINMRLRKAEKYNRNWARQKLDEFMKMISMEYKTVSEPKFGGKGMATKISKK